MGYIDKLNIKDERIVAALKLAFLHGAARRQVKSVLKDAPAELFENLNNTENMVNMISGEKNYFVLFTPQLYNNVDVAIGYIYKDIEFTLRIEPYNFYKDCDFELDIISYSKSVRGESFSADEICMEGVSEMTFLNETGSSYYLYNFGPFATIQREKESDFSNTEFHRPILKFRANNILSAITKTYEEYKQIDEEIVKKIDFEIFKVNENIKNKIKAPVTIDETLSMLEDKKLHMTQIINRAKFVKENRELQQQNKKNDDLTK